MLLRFPLLIAKIFLWSFLAWVLLLTAIPQISLGLSDSQVANSIFQSDAYPYNSLTTPAPLPISNSTVYFIIGHPDDEVMFFSPSIVELTKAKHNNLVKIVCFSKGDAVDPSFGNIRAQELRNSARIIGIARDDVIILEGYKDGMDVEWDTTSIAEKLMSLIKGSTSPVVVTFDERGVSNHPNHIALFHGCLKYFETLASRHTRLYVLKSLGFLEKYLATILTNVELLVQLLSEFFLSILKINVDVSFFNSHNKPAISSIKFYSDLNMLSVSYAAMAYGHFSQMVWFRYGWLFFSRYLTFNHLVQLH